MTVTATSAPSATDPTAAVSTASANALTGSKDEFLKLFMAQLENQDPLNPQDGAGMVAQLAQFSSVEQATETNQHLTDLTSQEASSANATLASLVGRSCSAGAADFAFDRGGAAPPIEVSSSSAMNGASVVISDDSGKEVRRIPIPSGVTSAQVAWDGNTASGVPAAAGNYHISIDAGSSTSSISSQWRGRIDAVELNNGSTELRMGGVLLAPSAIQTIGLTTP